MGEKRSDKEMQSVFIDADAFVRIYDPKDAHHAQALQISRQLYERNAKVLSSFFVLAEAATVISQTPSFRMQDIFWKKAWQALWFYLI